MGNIKIPYLITKVLKSGKKLYFWQPPSDAREHGFKGRPLGDNLEKAIQEAQKHTLRLREWRAGRGMAQAPKRGTVDWLIEEYRKDDSYLRLAVSTRRTYEQQFATIKNAMHDFSAKDVDRMLAKQFYHDLLEHPRKAKYAVQVARIIWNFGKDIGTIESNPFESLNVRSNPPREQVWTPEELENFIAQAKKVNRPSIALAVRLGADTGQRQGDILSMAWNQYDGKTIRVKQSKTKARVEIPVTAALKKALDSTTRISPLMVVEETAKKPFSVNYFRKLVRSVAKEAKVRDEVQFMDLRRTAVVRLAEAGCTVPEIASITGHKIDDCQRIVDTYLPKTKRLAENAILKLERVKQS